MGVSVLGISTYKKSEKIEKIEQNSRTIRAAAQKYFAMAENQRNSFQYKESVENYLTSILIDRNNVVSYKGAALSYKNLKNYDKAIEFLKKAEKIAPDDASIKKELAMCNIILGNFCNGIGYLIMAIGIEPKFF